MLDIVRQQVERAKQDFPNLQATEQPDGSVQIIIDGLTIPQHWGRESMSILAILPPGYPQAAPNGFQAKLDGQNWSGVCYRPQTWDSGRENLWKWIKLIERFFQENRP
nr:hypothetical protein [Candidatus Njordarchaeota archaeon]